MLLTMGKHKDWRKEAKRERRRRIRTQVAKKRDEIYNNEDYVKEQEMLHAIELEMIEKTNAVENEKWLNAERIAIHQWQQLQALQKVLHQARLEKEAKLKIEWELEKQKKKIQAEKLKAIEEENRIRQEKFEEALEEFMSGDSVHPPKELLISRETRPGVELCPFFSKTSCCRFGDQCSRNHKYPGISTILLATNFYDHFGMNNAAPTEYDTDIMLEYEDSDTYKEFKEFFYDVIREFEKFGKIIHFKVCNNFEKHLRGNVYVQYEELRCAVRAYRSLHSRWYGGRQLSLQFCQLPPWKNALCGMQFNRRCPKGRNCNYLHVFRNPDNLFIRYDTGEREAKRLSSKSWRWSESPPLEIIQKSRTRDKNNDERKNRVDDKRYDDSCSEDDSKRNDKHYDKKQRSNDNRHRESRRGSYSEKRPSGSKYYDYSSDSGGNSSDDNRQNRASNKKSDYTRKSCEGDRRRRKSRSRSSYVRKGRDDSRKYYDDSEDSYSKSDSDSNDISDYDSSSDDSKKHYVRKYEDKRSVDGKSRPYRSYRKRNTEKRKHHDDSDTDSDTYTSSSDDNTSNDDDSDTSQKRYDKRQRDYHTKKRKSKKSDK